MQNNLRAKEIDQFLNRFSSISKSTQIEFKRHLGGFYRDAPTNLKLATLYCLPENVAEPSESLLQNLYFVDCMCGTTGVNGEDCSEVVADRAFSIDYKRNHTFDASNNRFSPILNSHPGIDGDFYNRLGKMLYKHPESINGKALSIDLQEWDRDNNVTKRKWATAYLKKWKIGDKKHE